MERKCADCGELIKVVKYLRPVEYSERYGSREFLCKPCWKAAIEKFKREHA